MTLKRLVQNIYGKCGPCSISVNA